MFITPGSISKINDDDENEGRRPQRRKKILEAAGRRRDSLMGLISRDWKMQTAQPRWDERTLCSFLQ